jgi:hypothetical protein
MCFDPRELYLPVSLLQGSCSLSNFLYEICVVPGVLQRVSVILLSVHTVAVRGLFSGIFRVATASRAFIMAICSAGLFEHLLSNLDLICVTI